MSFGEVIRNAIVNSEHRNDVCALTAEYIIRFNETIALLEFEVNVNLNEGADPPFEIL
jgi:hypothetical protein